MANSGAGRGGLAPQVLSLEGLFAEKLEALFVSCETFFFFIRFICFYCKAKYI